MDHLIAPHGGELIDLIVSDEQKRELKKVSMEYTSITLSDRQICDLELLMNGAFSPLNGFMNRNDYESVLSNMSLEDGTLWSLPVCLDVSEDIASDLESDQRVALRDLEGFMLAVMHIEDIWSIDKAKEAKAVFGTEDEAHPGVDYLINKAGTHYIGGRIEGVSLPLHFDFKQARHTPRELRDMFAKMGWRRIVGFGSRNPLHKAQYEMSLLAMKEARANLLIQPVVGYTKPGDIDYYTRVRCLQAAVKYYPYNTMQISLLPMSMRMAGPREAMHQAIVRKNYGCSHFILGRDHAGPGEDNNGKAFYDPYASHELLDKYKDELGIEIMFFKEMVYSVDRTRYIDEDEVAESEKIENISGTQLRQIIRSGKDIPEWFTFPEVVDELKKTYPPRHRQGFTIFMTGLSGSGKSTVAKVLLANLLENGDRPVTLLDGDIVRTHLSSELGFSKEHRDINIRRIGYVASEITKNRGIAICAPIAPYLLTRRQIRHMIEQYGGFIEVHVSTPLEVCEQRDRKGIYAKARAGIIKEFTGIDDPYEAPENPEVNIDTTDITPDEAAQEVLIELQREGYIK